MAKIKIVRKDGKLQRWCNSYLIAPTLYSPAAPIPSYPTDSLISRYDFNDNLNDSYGSNNGWSSKNTPAQWDYGTGLINKDFRSNSTTSNGTYKSIYNNTNNGIYGIINQTNWSISLWLKITNASQDYAKALDVNGRLIFAFGGNSFKPSGTSNGCVFLYGGSTIGSYNIDFRDSTWHHFVMVDNGTTLKLYVDNTERISASSPSFGTSSDIGIMAQSSDGASWACNGEMDLLYFYEKALDTTEINTLYNGGSGI